MENLSHSRKPSRGSSQAALTKRTATCNGATNFSGKTMYDDVFGGPPRFGTGGPTLSPRPEDYTEIFGGFHASRGASIPVLDLPLVDDSDEVMFDVRNPRFNYAEVFGGFDGLDFAASYEELMRQANGGGDHDRDGDSSEEAWMQAETESLSEGSDHSGKYQYFSNGDYYEQIDSSMEFNISYHKANLRRNRDMSNGVTHVAQLHADPEYAYVIETPLQKTDNLNPPLHVTDDIDLEFTSRVTKKKHLRKTLSHPSNWTAGGGQTFTNDSIQREYRRNGSSSNEMFVTISEINLRTLPSDVPPPSRPPPLVDVKNGDYENGQTAASGGRMGDGSPPFFDVEIDSSSAAAASAAAMKEAMDKAQAKLKSAKELLERKREGIKNSTKPGSKSNGKGKKERASKAVHGFSDIKDERLQGIYEKEDGGIERSVREERQKGVKTQAPISLEGEKIFNVPKRFVVEKHGKESQSILEVDDIDAADEWQEATQFFELVRTDKSRMGFEQTNNDKVLMQSMQSNELQHKAKKESIGALELQLDSDNKVEAVREDHELEKVERDMKTAKESCERGEPTGISKAAKEARRHKGHEKKVKEAQEVSVLEENGQSITARKPLRNGKKPTGADELEQREKRVNAQQKEIKVEVGLAMELKENGQQEKETSKSIENAKRVEESQEREGQKRWREVFEQEKNETKCKQAENEKRLSEALEQEEKEKRLKEAREREEIKKKEKEACELEESEKIWRMALEQIENEKRLKQAHMQEVNERRQRKALEQEEMEKKQREVHEKEESKRRLEQVTEQGKEERQQKEVIQREETENKIKEACEKVAIDKGLKEACEKEETAKRLKEAHEKENIEKMLKEAVEQKDYSKPVKEAQDTEDEVKQKVVEQVETEEVQGVNCVHQHTERVENGKKLKIAEGTHQHVEGEDPVVSDEVNKLDCGKKHQENQLVGNNDQNCDELEQTEESRLEENGKKEAEFRDGEKKSEAMGKGNVDGKFNASEMAPGDLEVKVNQFRKDEVSDLCHQDDGVKKAGEAGIGIGQRNAEKINSVPGMDSDNNNQGLKFAYEWRERARNNKEAQVPSHLEENKDKFVSAQSVKESVETGRKPEVAKSSVLEGKGSTQRTVQQVKISQSTERRDKNINDSLTPEEKEAERLKRERELEMERLRKMEEEREREREREKDRMAVDRAALEARERGYVETRERAARAAVERATAEARQRAMAEARDRLEKACAEAREKSSMEARLRAERAAVERATAEARERAVEKAMAERAAFEARERVERSMSDKFSTSSRNSGMRTSTSSSDLQDQHFQSTGSFGGLRYPYSSAYNGVEGESAQRCKARLERYRRTAERAAKALEEKNMRDLIAQREQAERNRLAETLDADVKRWSSGKEGNLRALLSTLQYILGPDSGWHPIPLTEVITSAAVKKAYRKATLCVHPDKLQQRGASIQQKYICEKVFDLLKEAWNKFNSEER
ncbi:Chaperone DnaJ-domain superfamily protein, putative isoform 1 [Theobroma cacao]|uniref:Chaperone DnaJ-domain superfamily protein, putative isoform 1 n=1 Tax=Theobroma cacao TaxID=3641 RepID=A0A061DH07_THECC|nr:Chaperone DnaJ-domain superfamily protein, putative isoform 1 [Theobroma cacao]